MKRNSFFKWKSSEWDAVVAIAAMHYVKGRASSETEAFRMANAEMPEGRRRMYTNDRPIFPSSYKDWGLRWGDAVRAARAAEAQALLHPEPTPAPAVAPTPAPALQNTGDTLFDTLMGVMLAALESPRGQEALRNAFRVPGGVPEEQRLRFPGLGPTAPVAQRKRSIFIVGLLGSQQQAIKDAFKDTYSLRFMSQDGNIKQMRENARTSDTTYAMVSYMHHTVSNALKKAAAGADKQYQNVNGTVGELKRLLDALSK